MTVFAPDPDLLLLTSPTRVGAFLAQEMDDLSPVDDVSLWQACADATAIVLDHLMRSDLDGLAPEVSNAVVFVATKVAARIYRNPRELTTSPMGEATITVQDPRILTPDEERKLRRARGGRLVRGPIVLG